MTFKLTTDVDECTGGMNRCHDNAACNNTHGSYTTALVIVDTQAMGFLAQVRSFIMFMFNAPLCNISCTNHEKNYIKTKLMAEKNGTQANK